MESNLESKKKIALIGGAGFIGHHLALHLAERGHEVSIIDSFGVNNFLNFVDKTKTPTADPKHFDMLNERIRLLRQKDIPIHVCDARNYHELSGVVRKTGANVFVMLAAVAHADRSNKDPSTTFEHSLRTLENALDCTRGVADPHFIFFSSSMVYGNFLSDEVSEDTPCNPLGIYGAVKFSGEKIVNAYNQVFGLPYTIIRPSALYGERCVSRRVCQIFVENAIQGKTITVSGDGGERLDFTYIADLVDGVTRTIENPRSRNQTFNLTFGASRSVADIARIVQSEFPGAKVEYVPKDKLTPSRGTLSVVKARELLGYIPQHPIETAIPRYINWYREFTDRSRH